MYKEQIDIDQSLCPTCGSTLVLNEHLAGPHNTEKYIFSCHNEECAADFVYIYPKHDHRMRGGD